MEKLASVFIIIERIHSVPDLPKVILVISNCEYTTEDVTNFIAWCVTDAVFSCDDIILIYYNEDINIFTTNKLKPQIYENLQINVKSIRELFNNNLTGADNYVEVIGVGNSILHHVYRRTAALRDYGILNLNPFVIDRIIVKTPISWPPHPKK